MRNCLGCSETAYERAHASKPNTHWNESFTKIWTRVILSTISDDVISWVFSALAVFNWLLECIRLLDAWTEKFQFKMIWSQTEFLVQKICLFSFLKYYICYNVSI